MRPDKVTFDYGPEETEAVSHADIHFPGRDRNGRMFLMFQEQQEAHVLEDSWERDRKTKDEIQEIMGFSLWVNWRITGGLE